VSLRCRRRVLPSSSLNCANYACCNSVIRIHCRAARIGIVSTDDGILLFNGGAMTGRIEANGNYADLRSKEGSRDFNSWPHVVPTTTGRGLQYSWVTGGAVLGVIGTE